METNRRPVRQAISQTIRFSLLRARFKASFHFVNQSEPIDQDMEVIKAESPTDMVIILPILRWLCGSENVKVDNKTTTVINTKNVTPGKKRLLFFFSPKLGSTAEEIETILKEVSKGSYPTVKTHDGKLFSIGYIRKKTMLEKVTNNLFAMGWPVALNENRTAIELNLEKAERKTEKNATETSVINETEELMKFLTNPKLTKKISSETLSKIQNYFTEEKPEEYALLLLSHLTKK